ncbi:MAG: MmgE/PrpD family protein [Dehalococcoidia bacterium]
MTLMDDVSTYIATALEKPLPPEVAEKTKHHLLDTLGAIVSGSQMLPGQMSKKVALAFGGVPESTVIGTDILTSAAVAAMANGMSAHADETDDSHAPSLTHPGCAIVPASMAMAERQGRGGDDLLRAVALGYDIGTRVTMALGYLAMDRLGHASHTIGPMFGSAAAAGALVGATAQQCRYLLSYTSQQAAGITTWPRDSEHVEKSFVFGGQGARNGVTSAIFVSLGLNGVDDVFSGEPNFFTVFSNESNPARFGQDLGSVYEVMNTNIKKWSVGSPIQAPAEALHILMREHGFKAEDVAEVNVKVDPRGARIVNAREMPDVNLQYILAVTLLDGGLTFAAAHDYPRMAAADVQALRQKITLEGVKELEGTTPPRQAIVTVTTTKGESYRHHMVAVPGTATNPMSRQEVQEKCLDLFAPTLGSDRANQLIERVFAIEGVADVRELRPLLTA